VNRWIPDPELEIKGVILFHHGLAEHSLRYDRFGSICAENGYILNVYDMRGHGKSCELNNTIYGKLADKDGFSIAVRDFEELKISLEKEFEGKKIFLIGHSFGSFIIQSYLQSDSESRFSNVAGAVLIGSTGPNQLLIKSGNIVSSVVRKIKGNDYISKFVSKLIFGSYNNKIENPKSKYSWLCSNDFVVQMYEYDDWCGRTLTVSFYNDMIGGLNKIHSAKNLKKVKKDLPLLILFGSDDPVCNYGKLIKKLYKIYKKLGVKDMQMKEYIGCRHEVLNEKINETVENDIFAWFTSL
jgi:alpha-beta hydrolase superfamily lysophospholipase